MPSDSEIRDRFHEGTQPKGEIDVSAVLRRVRARRRPKVLLAGAGSVLAIAAIAVPAVFSSYTSTAGTDSAFSTADEAAVPESGGDGDAGGSADEQVMQKDAQTLNRCMAPVADVVLAENGMVITVEPVTASASADSIPITVTLTNDGDEGILGTTGGRPTLTLSRDGVTIWHTNGPQDLIARIVDLGPGESMTYETTFEPVVCGEGDDDLEAFPDDLPDAGPGAYRLSAAIDVSRDDSIIELVTGPEADVRLN